MLLLHSKMKDLWKENQNHYFKKLQVGIVYEEIGNNSSPQVKVPKWIWKNQFNPKCKLFLWKLFVNGLPTRTNMHHMNQNWSAVLDVIKAQESIWHIFISCPETIKIWKELLKDNYEEMMTLHSIFWEWIEFNMRCDSLICHDGIPWKFIFISTLLVIWRSRNTSIFDTRKAATARLELYSI